MSLDKIKPSDLVKRALNALTCRFSSYRDRSLYRLTICIFCSLLLLPIVSHKAVAQSDTNPSVVFIYGLSKSMWAKLDNEIKVTITQKALSSALKTYDKKINAG